MNKRRQSYTSFDENLEKTVRLLKSKRPGYLSGEEISRSLGISRAAVWKDIKKLKGLGYRIISRQNIGYRLVSKTSLLLPWEIQDGLQTEIIGRKIYYFDTIDSTQNFAMKLASKPYENGSVVLAGRQTSGRGRQNRKWASPRGGIWLSILLRPDFEVYQASLFPMLTSLALAIAIEKELKLKPKIKWPNDVILENKKAAGVLVDASVESNKIDYLVIGIGINFKVRPSVISKSLANLKNFYGAATLVGKTSDADPVVLLQAFFAELERMYNMVVTNNLIDIQRELAKRTLTIGKMVDISTPSGRISGRATGLDVDGALLVSIRGKTHRVLVGDINSQR